MQRIEHHWKAKDWVKLFAHEWRPEKVKGAMLLVHGIGEHSLRYDHVAAYFGQRGIAVGQL